MLYIINVWIDYCKILSDDVGFQSKMARLLLNLWYKFDTAIPNGCPSNEIFIFSHTTHKAPWSLRDRRAQTVICDDHGA